MIWYVFIRFVHFIFCYLSYEALRSLCIPCSLPPVKRKIKNFFSQYIYHKIQSSSSFTNVIYFTRILFYSSYTPSALFLLTIKFFKNISKICFIFCFLFHIIFTRYLLHFLEMMYDTQNDLEFCLCNLIFFFFFFLLFKY